MTVAGGGDQARRHADVAAREKSEGCAGSGLAEPVWCCDAHAVTRDPMVTGGARTAALGGGGSGDTARKQRRRPTALGQPGGGHGDPRERGGERNRRERSRRRWIAAPAITGEQKGNTRRDDEGSIQRGGSISGVQEEDYGGELTNEEEAALAARSVSRRGGRDAEAARHREGTAGEEGRERWCPELLVTRPRMHRLLRCSATDDNGESGTSSNKAATVVRRQWRGGGELTLAVKCSAGGSGGFVGGAKAATAWMRWAAKAVDRATEIEPLERGLARSVKGRSWRSRPWSWRWQAVTPMVVGQKEKGGGEREARSKPIREGSRRVRESSASGFWQDARGAA
uniref:Fibroin-like protein n=1 Tax=Oryza sativa subsp. japonica TaxID=39947 RepID=Q6Z484_ORYSJ|nr:fibroin-like protein [Oryza sativa Japonica Group]